MLKAIPIDIVSDVVCPWCFVGKRRLERALTQLPDLHVEVRWRPFQLDSTIPKEGMPRADYLRRKFGSDERIAELHKPLKAVGAELGIPFAFEKITVSPNTLNAHRLLRWADEAGKQDALAERLFNLYFIEGGDLSDKATLLQAAIDSGLDGTLVSQLLASDADLDPVIAEITAAQEMGVNSVPTFIVANRYAVVGAQTPEVIASALTRAALEARATG